MHRTQWKIHRVAAFAATTVLGLAAAAATHAQGQAAGFPAVAQPEQAARDVDRARILNDELTKEQGRLTEAAKRRGERLAARDAQGVAEAEAAHLRAASSIEALKREIELVGKTQRAATASAPPTVTAARAARQPLPSVEAPTTPWWDVYSKAPRRGTSVAAHQVSASGEPAPVAVERAQ